MAQVKLLCIVRARPGQTAEEFKRRWLDKHTEFAATWKNIKSYRVMFPNPEVHEFKGEGAMFDGIGELIWDSKEEMQEDMDSARGAAGFADADEFMEAYINMYCEENIIELKN